MSAQKGSTSRASTVIERTFRTHVEELWKLWTTKEGFESWWGSEGSRVEVHTIEHLLGSFWALQVDNALVEIDAEEVPGLDGSARDFVAALQSAGVVEQRAERKRFVVRDPIYVREGNASLVAAAQLPEVVRRDGHPGYREPFGVLDGRGDDRGHGDAPGLAGALDPQGVQR